MSSHFSVLQSPPIASFEFTKCGPGVENFGSQAFRHIPPTDGHSCVYQIANFVVEKARSRLSRDMLTRLPQNWWLLVKRYVGSNPEFLRLIP